MDVDTMVLVEGASDQQAVETLAQRRGRDLASEGIAVVPIGGATNIGHFVTKYGPRGSGLRLAGLCDAPEQRVFARGLERAGLGTSLNRDDMEALGFFVCVADLEEELIRSLGTERVTEVLARQGELGSFRTFQKQPAQRARADELRLRRFLGTRSGRKIHYARLLAESLDPSNVPPPLDGLMAWL